MVAGAPEISFFTHHFDRAIRGKLEGKTIQNCHVFGLTSICLHDEPGNRVRIFYAEPNHELWRNSVSEHSIFTNAMSLGVHSHRTDVRLAGIFGRAENITVQLTEAGWNHTLDECDYESEILDGKSSLKPTGKKVSVRSVQRFLLTRDNGFCFMPADRLHTVYIPKGNGAAWMVTETTKAKRYDSKCYTNNPVMDPRLYKMEDCGWSQTVFLSILREIEK